MTSSPSSPALETGLRSLQAAAFCGLGTQHIFLACVTPLAMALGLPAWLFSLVLAASGLAWIAGTRWWGRSHRAQGPALRTALSGLGLAMLALAGWTAGLPGWTGTWPASVQAAVLLASRSAMSFCLAGIPVLAMSWLAAHTPPAGRAVTLSRYASAGALGMVLAPAVAALASQAALPTVLAVTALLPICGAAWMRHWPQALPPLAAQTGQSSGPAQAVAQAERSGAMPGIRPPGAPSPCSSPAWPLRMGAGLAYGAVIACNLSLSFLWPERHGMDGAQALSWSGISLAAAGLGAPLAQAWMRRRPWRDDAQGMQAGALSAALGLAGMALTPWAWSVPPCLLLTGLGVAWLLPHLQSAAMAGVPPSQLRAVASQMAGMQGWAMLAAPAASVPLLAAGAAWPALAAAAALLGCLRWCPAPRPLSRLT